jgi:hypothetical protein
VLPHGWLPAGFHRLLQAWASRDGTLTKVAEAFPVTSDAL